MPNTPMAKAAELTERVPATGKNVGAASCNSVGECAGEYGHDFGPTESGSGLRRPDRHRFFGQQPGSVRIAVNFFVRLFVRSGRVLMTGRLELGE